MATLALVPNDPDPVTDAPETPALAAAFGAPASPDLADARLAAAGDMAAFERLYRRHLNRVHTLAGRMLAWGDVEDVVQDVFIRCWERMGSFRGDAQFSTWLHRLAVNVILGHRASAPVRRQQTHEGGDALGDIAHEISGPENALDFEAAIARLPDGMREIFILHDVEGYKHEEIARTLGISPGTSKSQLHRSRMALRRYLDA